MIKRNTEDAEKKKFESEFMKFFAARTRLPQSIALSTAREHVETVLAMFNDGYTAEQTASYLASIIDPEAAKTGFFEAPAQARVSIKVSSAPSAAFKKLPPHSRETREFGRASKRELRY